MPRRWHHGHSLAAGTLAGVLLASYRVWTLLAVAFLVGVLAALVVVHGRRLVRWIAVETQARRYYR